MRYDVVPTEWASHLQTYSTCTSAQVRSYDSQNYLPFMQKLFKALMLIFNKPFTAVHIDHMQMFGYKTCFGHTYFVIRTYIALVFGVESYHPLG